MRRLAELLSHNLGYIFGEREAGPNGDKKTFLNLGKVFLRALAKDLGLHDVKVTANPAGIGVSGDCSLYGMWEEGGIYICLVSPCPQNATVISPLPSLLLCYITKKQISTEFGTTCFRCVHIISVQLYGREGLVN